MANTFNPFATNSNSNSGGITPSSSSGFNPFAPSKGEAPKSASYSSITSGRSAERRRQREIEGATGEEKQKLLDQSKLQNDYTAAAMLDPKNNWADMAGVRSVQTGVGENAKITFDRNEINAATTTDVDKLKAEADKAKQEFEDYKTLYGQTGAIADRYGGEEGAKWRDLESKYNAAQSAYTNAAGNDMAARARVANTEGGQIYQQRGLYTALQTGKGDPDKLAANIQEQIAKIDADMARARGNNKDAVFASAVSDETYANWEGQKKYLEEMLDKVSDLRYSQKYAHSPDLNASYESYVKDRQNALARVSDIEQQIAAEQKEIERINNRLSGLGGVLNNLYGNTPNSRDSALGQYEKSLYADEGTLEEHQKKLEQLQLQLGRAQERADLYTDEEAQWLKNSAESGNILREIKEVQDSGKSFEQWYQEALKAADEAQKAYEEYAYYEDNVNTQVMEDGSVKMVVFDERGNPTYRDMYSPEEAARLKAEAEAAQQKVTLAYSVMNATILDQKGSLKLVQEGKKIYEETREKLDAAEQQAKTDFENAGYATNGETNAEGNALNGSLFNSYKNTTSYARPTDQWKAEEVELFYYWTARDKQDGTHMAHDYAKAINDGYANAEAAAKINATTEKITNALGGNGAKGVATSIAASMAAAVGTATASMFTGLEMADTMIEYAARGEVAAKNNPTASAYISGINSEIARKLNDSYGTFGEGMGPLAGKGWGDFYQVAYSAIQSAETAALATTIGGASLVAKAGAGVEAIGLTTARQMAASTMGAGMEALNLSMFFGNAAASELQNQLSQGRDPKQAIGAAIIAGASEVASEILPVDILLKQMGGTQSWKAFMGEMVKSTLSEGLEEVAGDAVGLILNEMAFGVNDIEEMRDGYMALGYTKELADKMAYKDYAYELAFDFMSGALSAGFTTSGNALRYSLASMSSEESRKNQKDPFLRAYGELMTSYDKKNDEGIKDKLVDAAIKYGEDHEKSYSAQYAQYIKDGRIMPWDGNYGKLLMLYTQETGDSDFAGTVGDFLDSGKARVRRKYGVTNSNELYAKYVDTRLKNGDKMTLDPIASDLQQNNVEDYVEQGYYLGQILSGQALSPAEFSRFASDNSYIQEVIRKRLGDETFADIFGDLENANDMEAAYQLAANAVAQIEVDKQKAQEQQEQLNEQIKAKAVAAQAEQQKQAAAAQAKAQADAEAEAKRSTEQKAVLDDANKQLDEKRKATNAKVSDSLTKTMESYGFMRDKDGKLVNTNPNRYKGKHESGHFYTKAEMEKRKNSKQSSPVIEGFRRELRNALSSAPAMREKDIAALESLSENGNTMETAKALGVDNAMGLNSADMEVLKAWAKELGLDWAKELNDASDAASLTAEQKQELSAYGVEIKDGKVVNPTPKAEVKAETKEAPKPVIPTKVDLSKANADVAKKREERKATLEAKKDSVETKGATVRRDGSVTTRAIEKNELGDGFSYRAATAEEMAKVPTNIIGAIAKALHIDVVIYASEGNAKGDFQGANGAYQDGVIYLDIHAGLNNINDLSEAMVLRTMAHELTHYLQQNAGAAYTKLENFLFKSLTRETGLSKEALIERKMLQRGTNDPALARVELIADACETMLKNNQMVFDFVNANRTEGGAIKRFLDNFVQKFRGEAAKIKADDEMAKYLERSGETMESARQLFADALKEAAKNAKAPILAKTEAKKEAPKTETKTPVPPKNGDFAAEKKAFEAMSDEEFAKVEPSADWNKAKQAAYKQVKENRDLDAMLAKKGPPPAANKVKNFGDPMNSEEEVHFALRRNNELMGNAIDYNGTTGFVPMDVMKAASDARRAVASYMKSHEATLKLPADVEGNVLFGNQSYGKSAENTTVCIRSLAQDAVVAMTEKKLGRKLSMAEAVYVTQTLSNYYTDMPQCAYCYVAADRMAFDDAFANFFGEREKVFGAVRDGKTLEQAINIMAAGRTKTDTLKARATYWYNAAKSGELEGRLQPSEVAGMTFSDESIAEYKAKMTTEAQKTEFDMAVGYARSASHAKKRVDYTAYNGNILDETYMPETLVDLLNSEFGLRLYSYSDYSPAFILENMQMVTDAAARGLKVLAYTKELDFVKIFAETGMNINISVYGYMQNGELAMDAMQGADWEGAIALRDKYPNVGITFVVTDDAMADAAEQLPWVDVVLPYHSVFSGGGKIVDLYKYGRDYKPVQADKKISKLHDAKADPKEIFPTVHNNDLITYVKALQAAHLTPRFPERMKGYHDYINGNITDQEFRDLNPYYMKYVNETRRATYETPRVQPNFPRAAVDTAIESLKRMGKEGGYNALGRKFELVDSASDDAVKGILEGKAAELQREADAHKTERMAAEKARSKAETKRQKTEKKAAEKTAQQRAEQETNGSEDITEGQATDAGVRHSTRLGYHAGDLGKAEPRAAMSYSRDTGHFGTGTYFVGNEAQISDSYYGARPHETVDFSNYNLFRVKSTQQGYDLHDFLKGVNRFYDENPEKIPTREELNAAEKRVEEIWDKLYGEDNADDSWLLEGETEEDRALLLDTGLYKIIPEEEKLRNTQYAFQNVLTEAEKVLGEYSVKNLVAKAAGLLYDDDGFYEWNDGDVRYISEDDVLYSMTRDQMDHAVGLMMHDFNDYYATRYTDTRAEWADTFGATAELLGITKRQLTDALKQVGKDIKAAGPDNARTDDSASTRFMKALGYEGVDVSGTALDNTTYGSVIYDLKGKDLERKQEIGTARFSERNPKLSSQEWAQIQSARMSLYSGLENIPLTDVVFAHDNMYVINNGDESHFKPLMRYTYQLTDEDKRVAKEILSYYDGEPERAIRIFDRGPMAFRLWGESGIRNPEYSSNRGTAARANNLDDSRVADRALKDRPLGRNTESDGDRTEPGAVDPGFAWRNENAAIRMGYAEAKRRNRPGRMRYFQKLAAERGISLDGTRYSPRDVMKDVESTLYAPRVNPNTAASMILQGQNPFAKGAVPTDLTDASIKGVQEAMSDWADEQLDKETRAVIAGKTPPPLIPKGAPIPISPKQQSANRAKLDAMIKQYGELERGEGPVVDFSGNSRSSRNVIFPKKVKNTKGEVANTRRFARTAAEADTLPGWFGSHIEDYLTREDLLSYQTITDKSALKYAENRLSGVAGFERALREWKGIASSEHLPTKNDIALGELLLVELSQQGKSQEAMEILCDLAEMGTTMGQSIQALSMLKRMGGQGQLYYIQKVVDRLNKQHEKRIMAGKMPNITIDPNDADAVTAAQTRDELNDAIETTLQHIADQVPVTIKDKWDNWRYLAMLGNVRTHGRNFLGNAIFMPARFLKDMLSAAGQDIFIHDINKKNKSIASVAQASLRWGVPSGNAYMTYAAQDFDIMKDVITGENKYSSPGQQIMKKRKIFKLGLLNTLAKKNGDALDAEDTIFLKRAYINAMSEFLNARNANVTDLDKATLNKARQYAILEAQKATYRDFSALASQLNRLKKLPKVGWLLDGVLPFTKTPINILKRGIEYSPIGMMNAVAYAAKGLKNGDYDAAEFIDRLSAGMSGTMIAVLGYALAMMGVARGAGDDDEFDKLRGLQNYAIVWGDTTYTVDWAAPVALPFFVGVAFHDVMTQDGDMSVEDVTNAMASLAEPMMQLSMLDSLNDIIGSAQYADENKRVMTLVASAVSSYGGQALPTIMGQLARTIDNTRRSTYVDKNKDGVMGMPFIQRFVQSSVQAKVPGWESQRMAYVDAWGRTQTASGTDNKGWAALLNFLSPGYYRTSQTTAVDLEMERLYEATGENDVVPKSAAKYVTLDSGKYNFTADEYETVAMTQGQTAYEMLNTLTKSYGYGTMTDEQKVAAVKKVWDYAKKIGVQSVVKDYELDKWMTEAQNSGDFLTYLTWKALDNENGNEMNAKTTLLNMDWVNDDTVGRFMSMDFSPERELTDQYKSGYKYDLDDQHLGRLTEIRTELYLDTFDQMSMSNEWMNGDIAAKLELLSKLSSEVNKEARKRLCNELVAEGWVSVSKK